MTSLETSIQKIFPTVDSKYWMERLQAHPEDTWIQPTNKDNDDFTLFNTLYMEGNLIARKVIPIWKDGSYRGARIFFKYSLSVDFKPE